MKSSFLIAPTPVVPVYLARSAVVAERKAPDSRVVILQSGLHRLIRIIVGPLAPLYETPIEQVHEARIEERARYSR